MAAKKRVGRALPGRRLSEAGWSRGEVGEVGANGRALCRWCRLEILAKRRRTFCSEYCVHQWRLRSDPGYLREQVFLRDRGMCGLCGTDTVAAYAELKRSRGRAGLRCWRFGGCGRLGRAGRCGMPIMCCPSPRGAGSVTWRICGRCACAAIGR